MVKHLKKVCKTIISMLIKFVGFDHIFPESEVFIMGNSLLKTERKKHFIVRPFQSEMKSWKTFSALMILNLWFIFLIILHFMERWKVKRRSFEKC